MSTTREEQCWEHLGSKEVPSSHISLGTFAAIWITFCRGCHPAHWEFILQRRCFWEYHPAHEWLLPYVSWARWSGCHFTTVGGNIRLSLPWIVTTCLDSQLASAVAAAVIVTPSSPSQFPFFTLSHPPGTFLFSQARNLSHALPTSPDIADKQESF